MSIAPNLSAIASAAKLASTVVAKTAETVVADAPSVAKAVVANVSGAATDTASFAHDEIAAIEQRLFEIETYLAAHSAWIEKRFSAISHSVDNIEHDVLEAALKAETKAKALVTSVGSHVGDIEAKVSALEVKTATVANGFWSRVFGRKAS